MIERAKALAKRVHQNSPDDNALAQRVFQTLFARKAGPEEEAKIAAFLSEAMTFLSCAPEDAGENLERIDALMQTAQRDGVTAAELQQAKNKICAHIILQAERSANRLFSVGGNWIQRREYRTVAELVKSYQDVTLREIAAVLEKYPLTQKTTVSVGPLSELSA